MTFSEQERNRLQELTNLAFPSDEEIKERQSLLDKLLEGSITNISQKMLEMETKEEQKQEQIKNEGKAFADEVVKPFLVVRKKKTILQVLIKKIKEKREKKPVTLAEIEQLRKEAQKERLLTDIENSKQKRKELKKGKFSKSPGLSIKEIDKEFNYSVKESKSKDAYRKKILGY